MFEWLDELHRRGMGRAAGVALMVAGAAILGISLVIFLVALSGGVVFVLYGLAILGVGLFSVGIWAVFETEWLRITLLFAGIAVASVPLFAQIDCVGEFEGELPRYSEKQFEERVIGEKPPDLRSWLGDPQSETPAGSIRRWRYLREARGAWEPIFRVLNEESGKDYDSVTILFDPPGDRATRVEFR